MWQLQGLVETTPIEANPRATAAHCFREQYLRSQKCPHRELNEFMHPSRNVFESNTDGVRISFLGEEKGCENGKETEEGFVLLWQSRKTSAFVKILEIEEHLRCLH